ncbi:MAG: CRISPR-associated endonuclease Cas2 [Firmicutes bacterium]|jgi:CRISPR-associated protein Cas2|nr:CRISPR-associated endonuclease Cas2 [Bacillota bacterium]
MMVLITYDVNTENAAGRKRLRNIAKKCEDYGQRVQLSVFECIVDPQQLVVLKNQLTSIMDERTDSIRIYYLGSNWERRVEHIGAKPGYNPEGTLMV